MLNHVFSNRPNCIISPIASILNLVTFFYQNSVIMFEDGTQQGDLEDPPIFVETIQTLVKKLASKINIWYLDDGNLADDYKIVLRDLKNILKLEQHYGLSSNTEKGELHFWDRLRVHSIIQFEHNFEKYEPK